MSRRLKIGIVGLLVIGALAVVMTGSVLAQEETPTPAPKPRGCHKWGHGFGRSMGGSVGLEAAAQVLGLTADELSTQLWGGRSLAELADEAGVDLQDVQDAVTAAHEAAMRDAIKQAVQDGDLSEEHADWLLEGLEKGFLGGHGFGGRRGGFGRFRGGENGFGGFGRFRGGNNSTVRRSDI
jgi:hypothetical protein